MDTDTEDPVANHSLDVFSADGTCLEADAEGYSSVGVWEPPGQDTADLTFWFLDGEDIGVVRAAIEVAEDGKSLTATYTVEFSLAAGTSTGQIGQGEPVGSFEDFFGTPVATPAT